MTIPMLKDVHFQYIDEVLGLTNSTPQDFIEWVQMLIEHELHLVHPCHARPYLGRYSLLHNSLVDFKKDSNGALRTKDELADFKAEAASNPLFSMYGDSYFYYVKAKLPALSGPDNIWQLIKGFKENTILNQLKRHYQEQPHG